MCIRDRYVVNAAGGVISSDTAINVDSMLDAMNTAMESMNVGELVVLALESMLVSLCMKILSVLITVILYGRMIEIYLYTSVAPIPVSYTHLDVYKRQVISCSNPDISFLIVNFETTF